MVVVQVTINGIFLSMDHENLLKAKPFNYQADLPADSLVVAD